MKDINKKLYRDALNLTQEQAAEAWRLLFTDIVKERETAQKHKEIAAKNYYEYINKPHGTYYYSEREKQLKERLEQTETLLNITSFYLSIMVTDALEARVNTERLTHGL